MKNSILYFLLLIYVPASGQISICDSSKFTIDESIGGLRYKVNNILLQDTCSPLNRFTSLFLNGSFDGAGYFPAVILVKEDGRNIVSTLNFMWGSDIEKELILLYWYNS